MPVISDELFQQVASIVGNKNIKPQRTSTFAERARLYGLYKRATVGKLLGPYGRWFYGSCLFVPLSWHQLIASIYLLRPHWFYCFTFNNIRSRWRRQGNRQAPDYSTRDIEHWGSFQVRCMVRDAINDHGGSSRRIRQARARFSGNAYPRSNWKGLNL
jgi:hypothetical protein